MLSINPPGDPRLMPQRGAILAGVPLGGLTISRAERVAVNVDALELFVRPRITLEHRADRRNAITGVAQGAGLLPHPPVELQGGVFDEDEYVFRTAHQVARASRP